MGGSAGMNAYVNSAPSSGVHVGLPPVGTNEQLDWEYGVTTSAPTCDNFTYAGQIGYSTAGCSPMYLTIENTVDPSGGSGDIEVLWWSTTVFPCPSLSDPSWSTYAT
ncbi:MAG TPA: hypothetical protein PK858_02770, partial [Saprospiraceae bacterium]|nr:hypothetical protein [Saprospiraceae bacterium]